MTIVRHLSDPLIGRKGCQQTIALLAVFAIQYCMHNYIPDSKGKMMRLNLQGLWIITNYPVFRAAIQLPLSGGILFQHLPRGMPHYQ